MLSPAPFDFSGKVVVITGAAQGLGKVAAKQLAECGASIALVDIAEEQGNQVTADLVKEGHKANFFRVDLESEQEISQLPSAIVASLGRIDVLVNNARPRLQAASFAETMAEWDKGMAVLLKAPALLSKYCFPQLCQNKGSIVNLSSVAAEFISHQPVTYHVAKAGLVQLTRFLAAEFSSQGVRVNAVCPGVVELPDRIRPAAAVSLNQEAISLAIPLKRPACPKEIANCIIFLASSAASYVTGHVLVCDGGESLSDHFHIAHQALSAGKK